MRRTTQQNKRKRDTGYHPEMHAKDVNSREIFKNDTLTSQFLRNYTNIPIFANVQPEDIEDVSQKYRAFLGVEYESDTIKKVYIRREDGILEREVYVISLIEHKSDIDYDVAMQLLRYMTVIWQEYKKNRNKENKDASKRKNFRYPLIISLREKKKKYFVYEYLFEENSVLNVKRFDTLSEEWLEFIKENRSKGGLQHNYDVVIGPVADDNTMETVQLYIANILTASEAVERLRYNKVNNQVSFHTEKALQYLQLVRRESYARNDI